MKFGVVVFPGTWSDKDCFYVIDQVLHQPVEYIWHKDTNLTGFDCIILPGGFSYGDYLRCGAIAKFSPVMKSVEAFANAGGLVYGICNGFQILCESGLLPGVLIRNDHLQFRCEWTNLRIENSDSPFTSKAETGQVISVPISHGEGNYFADGATLDEIEKNDQVIFRYSSPEGCIDMDNNPNGSLNNIAGITNREGNVLGMMPHPERCCDPLLGSTDGEVIFRSISDTLSMRSS
ncbi:MAG: phosphoribosylformylglycinamidine synthase subunit PurQ [Chloroflexota bacterium]|nr:phosphoribosylformylglycinamidine synthase subunit PurQ [Chloroflexota bacterium]MEC9438971.1 phosphoribosylformylglycinamidine synthase subunit PurQ [Chloroflexota bacterium]MQF66268.1 phosphoribosylformylglycinamidine synthase subunit PurQ [SAR202 cluster bacterium AC-647-P02_OGT_505m]